MTPLTNFTGAVIFDPAVSFDGTKILFSMRPPGGSDQNIWEINADGTGLRQVTSGGGADFDPLYLPDGTIMFTSSRHGGMDEYNHSPAEVLYTCNYDGSGIKRVSFNMSDDFDPVSAARRHGSLHALGALRHLQPLPAVLHQSRRHRAPSTSSAPTTGTSSIPR